MQLQWLLLTAFGCMLVLAWLYRRVALLRVKYMRSFSHEAVYEDDYIEMTETLVNRKPLPLPWLRLESLLSVRLVFDKQTNLDIRSGDMFQNHISLFTVRPFRQIVRRHRIRCSARGLYRLESATMTAGDPFGFAQVARRFPLSLEVIVYPRPLPLGELPLPSHSWLGRIAVKRWIAEDPFLTAGTREYRPGDSLNSVHWKATARTGELQVHKRDYTADHRLWICLNVEITETMWKTVTEPQRIEHAIRCAAAVAEYALSRGVDTGFLCNGWTQDGGKHAVRLEPGSGIEQQKALLETMAKLQLESVMMFADLLQEEVQAGTSGADFLVITCHTAGGMHSRLDQLKRQGNGVEVMHVPEMGGTAT